MSSTRDGQAERLEQLALRATEMATQAGAEQADAFLTNGTECTIRVYEGVVESLTEAGSRGVGVRVFKDRSSGYAYSSDLSDAGLTELARSAVESATVTEQDDYLGLPEHCGTTDVGSLVSAEMDDWSVERKIELALEVEQAARGRDTQISNVEDTVYSDSVQAIALANSQGFAASYSATSCYAFAYAFAGQGEQLMTGMGVEAAREPGGLDPQAIGHEAADRALALQGANQPASRRCPVVLDPFVAASFAGIIGSRLSADAVQRGRSFFAGKEGGPVAAAGFTLVDDGTLADGLATTPFDDEGVPTRRNDLIRGGNLKSFMFDTYTARKEGRDSTGNAQRAGYRTPPSVATSNLVIEPGSATRDELISAAGDGLYVMGVKGLHSGVNAVTGQFSVGANGLLIENGRLAGPVREFTIASDLLTMLGGVESVGTESRWVPFGGSVKAAPILVGEMAVAGA